MKMKHILVFPLLIPILINAQVRQMKQTGNGEVKGSLKLSGSRRFPTMLDMTFPEFEATAANTDIALVPIGPIEEHGPNLPLATDSLLAVAQR